MVLLAISLYVLNPPWVRGSFDPLGLLQTGLGLIVGFCLTQYVNLANTIRNTRRDFIRGAANEAKAELKDLQSKLATFPSASSSEAEWRLVQHQTKQLGLAIETLGTLIVKECKMSETDTGFVDVKRAFEALRPSLGERQLKLARAEQQCGLLFRALSILGVRLGFL